ncbi:hypothetical protein DPMN_079438 [Dreissena polymorpha]|uniref:Uncharacterized protein n=1 Tax=Dreissena polymorpha TaxID=45954 RepID=A0A9D3YUG7_DREPO|nr:hypothetical protein DPMN_079420 [Dreissena polymorpha]KAH3704383.1 hypothetical protein DPMN_079438 [Dreissena polymorpha]
MELEVLSDMVLKGGDPLVLAVGSGLSGGNQGNILANRCGMGKSYAEAPVPRQG